MQHDCGSVLFVDSRIFSRINTPKRPPSRGGTEPPHTRQRSDDGTEASSDRNGAGKAFKRGSSWKADDGKHAVWEARKWPTARSSSPTPAHYSQRTDSGSRSQFKLNPAPTPWQKSKSSWDNSVWRDGDARSSNWRVTDGDRWRHSEHRHDVDVEVEKCEP